MPTLSRLNFYFVVPAIVYVSLVRADVSFALAGRAVGFSLAMLAGLAGLAQIAARLRRLPKDRRAVLSLTVMSYNSGNFGLPLQQLAFRQLGLSAQAATVQIFVMVTQNFCNFTIGLLLAASGQKDRHWRQNLLYMVKFPALYALAAALLTVQLRAWLGPGTAAAWSNVLSPFWSAAGYVADAMVAVALCTVGTNWPWSAATGRPTR